MSEERTIEEEIEAKERKRKITIGVIVAIVVIACIGVTVLLTKNSNPTEANALTLEGVNTRLEAVEAKATAIEGKTAENTEDIANIESDIEETFATSLEEYLEDMVFPDYSTELATINARIDAVEDLLGSLQYANVTRIEPGYVDITLFNGGDYAVLTTLYGLNLNSIEVRYPAEYSIKQTWGSNTTVTLAIEPVSAWVSGDLVELKLSGTLYYATAMVAQGCEGSVPEW